MSRPKDRLITDKGMWKRYHISPLHGEFLDEGSRYKYSLHATLHILSINFMQLIPDIEHCAENHLAVPRTST